MDDPVQKLNLGARLKSIRQQKGLTVRGLARKAGCSASFISQLELNQASPTIANFEKICGALKMSLVDMLREETHLQEPMKIPLHSDTYSLAMRWQKAWLRHLLPGHETKAFTALQLTLDVGGTTPSRRCRRSINELAIILAGHVELEVGAKTISLKPSEAIYFDLGMAHEWHNVGATTAEIILVHPYVFQLFEQEEEDFFGTRQEDFGQIRLIREYSAS
jgi:transcriptional regulator with XRE-family HTH domain